VSGNLYVVFNRPPTGVGDDEFNHWAIEHYKEILAVPGWASAQRFKLVQGTEPDGGIGALKSFGFMSLYEVETDMDTAITAMRAAGATGKYEFPEWYQRAMDESCFASWSALPLNEVSYRSED
jgi:hypothetical protein